MQLMHLFATRPTSLRAMLALSFLRAYYRINRCKSSSSLTSSSSSCYSIIKRSRRIKLAADASMARAAGAKRAWSRALLHKLRRQARLRGPVRKPKNFITEMKKRKVGGGGGDEGVGQAMTRVDKLRGLVPGGNGMDFYSLLGETANYIQCLTTQVYVMKGIADSLAP